MRNLPDKIIELLAKLPSTNSRIVVSLALAFGTGVKYWISKSGGWEPSWEWLSFLVAMMGLDVAQFGLKRATHTDFVKAKTNGGTK